MGDLNEDPDGIVHGYEMSMPFVTVTSVGGPHDDDSYAAGWEMGVLDNKLTLTKALGLPAPAVFVQPTNIAQADLIAMKHDATMTVEHLTASIDDGPEIMSWPFATFTWNEHIEMIDDGEL